MSEYYVVTESFAAPFCSDTGHRYVEAPTPASALERVAVEYRHPAGLYSAVAYTSADAKNKGQKPLATWVCNHGRVLREQTKHLGAYTYRGDGPGRFELNGKWITVENPKAGAVV